MRGLAIFAAALALLGAALSPWSPRTTADGEGTSTWRRTADGWEKRDAWQLPADYFQPALRPAVVGAFILLASLISLLAGDRSLEVSKSWRREGAERRLLSSPVSIARPPVGGARSS